MRILVRILASITALFVCCQALADVNCSRSQLGNAVNAYIEAQTAGDPDRMPLAPRAVFMEQMERIGRSDSIVNTALAIDFHRSLLDEYTCQTYTEIIVLDESHSYSIGTRLRVTANAVSEVEVVVTDEGDWLFNAQNAFDRSSAEDWSIIPESERFGLARFGAKARSDVHLFRLEHDKLHYVHTLTVCDPEPMCGGRPGI